MSDKIMIGEKGSRGWRVHFNVLVVLHLTSRFMPGQGKVRKGLGKGGAKGHGKVMREDIEGIMKQPSCVSVGAAASSASPANLRRNSRRHPSLS
jgi:hypothetical protein